MISMHCDSGRRGSAVLSVLALLLGSCAPALATIINVDAGGRVPTNANRTSGASIFTFTAAGIPANIARVHVYLDIVHTWTEDLDIQLLSPSATLVQLVLHRGGVPQFHNFDDTKLSDVGGGGPIPPIADGTPPFRGEFVPEAALSAFNGEAPNGMWTLFVNDDFLGDYGWLYRAGDAQFETRRRVMSGTRLEIVPTPEPGTGALAAVGALAAGLARRRREAGAR